MGNDQNLILITVTTVQNKIFAQMFVQILMTLKTYMGRRQIKVIIWAEFDPDKWPNNVATIANCSFFEHLRGNA